MNEKIIGDMGLTHFTKKLSVLIQIQWNVPFMTIIS